MNELKTEQFGYDTFLSPLTWRYGSKDMKKLFSEKKRRATWRKVWVDLAKGEASFGLVSEAELKSIVAKSGENYVDIRRSRKIESKVKHDLDAELQVFSDQVSRGGGKLHLGATSADIEDNADILIFREALGILLENLVGCLKLLKETITKHEELVCMGWTHLQPAEPTTVGYRFCNYAQDVVMDIRLVEAILDKFVKGKGLKGAVGTSASFVTLLNSRRKSSILEKRMMDELGIEYFPISTQVYPRKVDYLILCCLSSIAQSCHKFGLDIRFLQSPSIGEISEPFGKSQIGSSTMPFKRNPTYSERMCSLARFISVLPNVAFMNAATMIFERTLDDSASRRIVLPEAFIATQECLSIYEKVLKGLQFHPQKISANLNEFAVFSGTEALLSKLVKLGCERKDMHDLLRRYSFRASDEILKGNANPLIDLLATDKQISQLLSRAEIINLLDARRYVGDAKRKSEQFLRIVAKPILLKYNLMSKNHRQTST